MKYLLLLLIFLAGASAQTCVATNVQCGVNGGTSDLYSNCGETNLAGGVVNIGNSTAECNVCGQPIQTDPYFFATINPTSANSWVTIDAASLVTNLPSVTASASQGYRFVAETAAGRSVTPGVIGIYKVEVQSRIVSSPVALNIEVGGTTITGTAGIFVSVSATMTGTVALVEITSVTSFISIRVSNNGGSIDDGSIVITKLPFTAGTL